jgi:hypothetical protein
MAPTPLAPLVGEAYAEVSSSKQIAKERRWTCVRYYNFLKLDDPIWITSKSQSDYIFLTPIHSGISA